MGRKGHHSEYVDLMPSFKLIDLNQSFYGILFLKFQETFDCRLPFGKK